MKKSFVFILLLLSMIFFSSCHDDGLSGIIDQSALKKTNDQNPKVASTNQEEEPLTLEIFMRKNPGVRRIIEILNENEPDKIYMH